MEVVVGPIPDAAQLVVRLAKVFYTDLRARFPGLARDSRLDIECIAILCAGATGRPPARGLG